MRMALKKEDTFGLTKDTALCPIQKNLFKSEIWLIVYYEKIDEIINYYRNNHHWFFYL
jgi:hypothetical protein